MKRIEIENLAALAEGKELNLYQKNLAYREFLEVWNLLNDLKLGKWCPLPDVEEKNDWIDVQIYPDRQGSYLCFMDNCYVKMCFWNESEWLDMWQNDLKGSVLYWMKLPEAP